MTFNGDFLIEIVKVASSAFSGCLQTMQMFRLTRTEFIKRHVKQRYRKLLALTRFEIEVTATSENKVYKKSF